MGVFVVCVFVSSFVCSVFLLWFSVVSPCFLFRFSMYLSRMKNIGLSMYVVSEIDRNRKESGRHGSPHAHTVGNPEPQALEISLKGALPVYRIGLNTKQTAWEVPKKVKKHHTETSVSLKAINTPAYFVVVTLVFCLNLRRAPCWGQ